MLTKEEERDRISNDMKAYKKAGGNIKVVSDRYAVFTSHLEHITKDRFAIPHTDLISYALKVGVIDSADRSFCWAYRTTKHIDMSEEMAAQRGEINMKLVRISVASWIGNKVM